MLNYAQHAALAGLLTPTSFSAGFGLLCLPPVWDSTGLAGRGGVGVGRGPHPPQARWDG